MTAYLVVARRPRSALYSTGQQWAQIVGTVPAGSTARRPGQLAGRLDLPGRGAGRLRAGPPLVPGGRVTLSQYVQRRPGPQPVLRLTGAQTAPLTGSPAGTAVSRGRRARPASLPAS